MVHYRISSIGIPVLTAAALLLFAQPSRAQHAGFHAGFRGGVAPGRYHGGITRGGFASPFGHYYYGDGFSRGWYVPGYRLRSPNYSYGRWNYPRYSSFWWGYPYGYSLASGVDLGSAYPSYPAYNPFVITYPIDAPAVVSTTTITATAAPSEDALHLHILVPPRAEVWINGVKTTQTGAQRDFVSPPLTPGNTYEYSVRARWEDEGRVIEQTRQVKFSPGQGVTLNFNVP